MTHYASGHGEQQAQQQNTFVADSRGNQEPPIAAMVDPRCTTKQVSIIGFYYPGKDEECDKLFKHGLFGNFYHCPEGVSVFGKRFTNAEAAFQALKFWAYVDQFASRDGMGAFYLKKSLESNGVTADWSYHECGGNFQAMWEVLSSKFAWGTKFHSALLNSGDAYLVEHNSAVGRDKVWSNNKIGDGKNWLGLQLMLLRDHLLEGCGRQPTGWTEFITGTCGICLRNGEATTAHGGFCWQRSVQAATDSVQQALNAFSYPALQSAVVRTTPAAKQAAHGSKKGNPHLCIRCHLKPTFDGKPGGYCTKGCRDAAQAPASSSKTKHSMCQRCHRLPTFDGQPGFCTKTCRDAHRAAAAVEQCQWCSLKPTFDGKPGFCSLQCRDKAQNWWTWDAWWV